MMKPKMRSGCNLHRSNLGVGFRGLIFSFCFREEPCCDGMKIGADDCFGRLVWNFHDIRHASREDMRVCDQE